MAPPRNPPPPPRPAGGDNAFTRKVGPLPVWAWAVLLLGAYFLYQHFKGSGGATATGTTPAAGTSQATPVPVGDQSGGGGAALGTSGTTPTPATAPVSSDATGSAQASGGGTSNGVTAVSQPTYSRPVYLGAPDTAVAAAMQEQVATTTSGRPTKVGGLYHPGQNF